MLIYPFLYVSKKTIYSVQNEVFSVLWDILGIDEGRSSYGQDKKYIKGKYGLSNYQMAQLTFVIKSTSSELSKILLMSIAFQNHLKLYIFLLIIMCF